MKFKIDLSFDFFKKKAEKCSNFIVASRAQIAEMSFMGRYATIRNYQTALNSFEKYVSVSNLAEKHLDCNVLYQYQEWLLRHGKCSNTSANYLRYLRALYNMLYDHDAVSPFSNVTTTNAATAKRSLSIDDIRKIQNVHLDEHDPLVFYRDIFLFSIYTFGIPFVDLARLTYRNINNSVVTFNRRKTNKPVTVVVLPEARRILDRYHDPGSEYLFPQINHEDDYMKYQYELAKYNRALRKLTVLAGTEIELTSYVARHTWASLAYSNGIELGIISQALGHSNLRTTMIYLRELDIEKMRIAGRNIMNSIFR